MIAKNLIWISLVAFVLALAAQPACSATIFVDAAAPPGGNGSAPAHAFVSLVDAVAAARVLPRQGALVIHLAAGTYPLPASKRGDGLLIDVPRLRLEGETQLSFDAAGVPQAVIGGATRITGVTGQALLRVRADGVSLSGLILDGVDRGSTSWTLVADGSPNFTMSKCVSYNAFFGVLVRSASATLEQNIFGTPAAANQMGALVAGGPEAANVSVVFQRNRVEGNGYFGAVFMGDNAAVASAYDPSVDSALHATIAGNQFVGNTLDGLALSLRENPYLSAVDHTAYLVADVHDNVVRDNVYFGVMIHAPQGVRGPEACRKSPPARVDAAFANNVFSGNGAGDGHFTFDAVVTDLGLFPAVCFVNFSSILVDFPNGSFDYVLGGTGNTLVINGVTE
jgi:hypothetical protein